MLMVWLIRLVGSVLVIGGLGWLGWQTSAELRTFAMQARLISGYAREMSYELREGPNPGLRYPAFGPQDRRLG